MSPLMHIALHDETIPDTIFTTLHLSSLLQTHTRTHTPHTTASTGCISSPLLTLQYPQTHTDFHTLSLFSLRATWGFPSKFRSCCSLSHWQPAFPASGWHFAPRTCSGLFFFFLAAYIIGLPFLLPKSFLPPHPFQRELALARLETDPLLVTRKV